MSEIVPTVAEFLTPQLEVGESCSRFDEDLLSFFLELLRFSDPRFVTSALRFGLLAEKALIFLLAGRARAGK